MRARAVRALSGVLLLAAGPAAAQDLRLPPFQTVTLENGLEVNLLRHPTVPLVSFELWIRAGAAQDPGGREGLAYLTAEALRKGAGERNAQAFALATDALGAQFFTSVDHDRTRIHLDLLSEDFDQGLALLADAALRPRFDEAEVKKLAEQGADAVAEAKDNPRNVLGTYHRAFLYGSHPYGNPIEGTEESLPALTAADLAAFHRDAYGADRAVLVVAGDLDAALAEQKVRAAAAEVVRTVFGGRFTSWLNQKLRIETGLTYGARFGFQRGFEPGPASISTFTAKETTKAAIDTALAQLDRLHEQGIPEADLASAKAYLKGQMPYDYETAEDLARAVAELRFYGLDRSHVDESFARIDAVDRAAVERVVERWFRREGLTFTAIGVAGEVTDVLRAYGELTPRENAAPGFR
jgi:predicted Zn-dependent peptidase